MNDDFKRQSLKEEAGVPFLKRVLALNGYVGNFIKFGDGGLCDSVQLNGIDLFLKKLGKTNSAKNNVPADAKFLTHANYERLLDDNVVDTLDEYNEIWGNGHVYAELHSMWYPNKYSEKRSEGWLYTSKSSKIINCVFGERLCNKVNTANKINEAWKTIGTINEKLRLKDVFKSVTLIDTRCLSRLADNYVAKITGNHAIKISENEKLERIIKNVWDYANLNKKELYNKTVVKVLSLKQYGIGDAYLLFFKTNTSNNGFYLSVELVISIDTVERELGNEFTNLKLV